MSKRRFTDKPALHPSAVAGLDDDHPAMTGNRTLFPSTVVEVTGEQPDRILVSGDNNRKIGKVVGKGRFSGYGIYMLTLQERATCPVSCEMRGACYGNGMQLARRHRIGDTDTFYDRLGLEIAELLDRHDGLLIRLHVLGDFPDVEYVSFWKEVLDEYPNVACYGYTHRAPASRGGCEIGDAIDAVKDVHPDRFRIRWSSPVARADGAVVLDHVPAGPRADDRSLVCPAQTDATACCATCALCWEAAAKRECIGFIRHGRATAGGELKAIAKAANEKGAELPGSLRPIVPMPTAGLSPSAIRSAKPRFVDIDPSTLKVETKYQRDLSTKSLTLIKRIVEHFDWTKFKPPICVEQDGEYFCIDGQHTAIGAASHPDLETIPVMVVDADSVEARASAFVAHNRDRVSMSRLQVFHGDVASGKPEAVDILRIAKQAGARIPRNPVNRRDAKIGDVVAVGEIEKLHAMDGGALLSRVLRIAVEGRCRPINQTILRALRMLLVEPQYEGVSEGDIVTALMARPDLEQAAVRFGAETNKGRYSAAAVILYRAASSISAGSRAA
ncbi:DUF6551 family protein [Nitratireductor sp. StC3]|uniref:GP88 family protein n=1 Tax=Nitratireductor sp. StC3 TaxID=2126741 RepID=UPI000D0CCB12|nr:DUF6551 family protein [Nitratireductor sp. StC3]PSM18238.1 hypothetical protein C7T96_10230 [Nitratireductor sp. StC3]